MPEEPIDEGVRAFVDATFGRRAGQVRALGKGEWSRAYALTLDGRDVVLRVGQHLDDYLKDQLIGRMAPADLPVPQVVAVGEADPGYFALSQHLPGRALDSLGASGMRRALPSVLALIDRLRAVEPPGAGYGMWTADAANAPYDTWEEALVGGLILWGRMPDWRERLQVHRRESAIFDRAVCALRETAAGLSTPRHLIHSDLLGNVLVHKNRISGVFDWGNSMYGDPLFDVAHLIYWWSWYPAWSGIRIEDEVARHFAATGFQPTDEGRRMRACLLHIGASHIAYAAWRGHLEEMRRNAVRVAGYLQGGPSKRSGRSRSVPFR